MRLCLLFILAILTASCQSESERKSVDAYSKGIQTLQNFSENGEPDYEEAHMYFAQSTTLNPDNISAQYWKADTEMKLGGFSEAYKTTTKSLNSSSIDGNKLKPNMLVMAGVLSIKLGRDPDQFFQKALLNYDARINKNINDLDAIGQKAVILCYMDKKDEAIRFLNEFSLNDENQILLDQIKDGIENFDADKILDELIIEK